MTCHDINGHLSSVIGVPPNENYRNTEVLNTLIRPHRWWQKLITVVSLNMKYENTKYQSTWGVSPNTTNIVRPEPRRSPLCFAVARQLTTIEQWTILENRKRIQQLHYNDDWKEKKINCMAAINEKKKMPIKNTFRVFGWFTPNQRRAGQVTWALLPGIGITHNRLT